MKVIVHHRQHVRIILCAVVGAVHRARAHTRETQAQSARQSVWQGSRRTRSRSRHIEHRALNRARAHRSTTRHTRACSLVPIGPHVRVCGGAQVHDDAPGPHLYASLRVVREQRWSTDTRHSYPFPGFYRVSCGRPTQETQTSLVGPGPRTPIFAVGQKFRSRAIINLQAVPGVPCGRATCGTEFQPTSLTHFSQSTIPHGGSRACCTGFA